MALCNPVKVIRVIAMLTVTACGGSSGPQVSETGAAASKAIQFDRVVVAASSPIDPWMKDVADIDGDGLPDLIVASADGPIVRYRTPGWEMKTISAHGTSERGSAVGDLVGDGDPDIVVGKSWFENIDHGNSWQEHRLPQGTAGTHDIAIANIDGNGKPDIIMRGERQSVVTVYLQTGNDQWQAFDVDPGIGLNGLEVADINGDGALDIVVGGIWMENPRTNVSSSPWRRHRFAADWNEYAAVKVIDIDRDGRLDIVLGVSEAKGRLSCVKQPADAASEPWQENVIAQDLDHVHCLSVADFDKDGALDVAASEYRGEGRLIIFRSNGGTAWTATEVGRDALHNVRALDVNHDGRVDLFGAAPYGVVPVILYQNTAPTDNRRVLVFSKTLGFRHASIPDGVAAIRRVGAENGFAVDATEDSTTFDGVHLAQYRAIIFLNPSGDVLDASQRSAFQAHIRGGGGFVGIHNSNALTLEDWGWYTESIGARCASEISRQRTTLRIIDSAHISTVHLPNPWRLTVESYNWVSSPRDRGVSVLIDLDESSVTGGKMGTDHPFSWYQTYDGGRAWYTVGGADAADFADSKFLRHVLGGIRYAGNF